MDLRCQSLAVAVAYAGPGCDYHHLLSGGIRRGHMHGVGLCPWHHRAVPMSGLIAPEMRALYGPSLAEGSKTFHEAFGSDAELVELQESILSQLPEIIT